MKYYIKAFRNYVNFKGIASRSEYWMFVVFNILFSLIVFMLDALIFTGTDMASVTVLSILYSLIVFLPSIAVAVRRLHDTGRSGKNLLIALIPLIGGIIVIVWLAQKSSEGRNMYNPIEPVNDDVAVESSSSSITAFSTDVSNSIVQLVLIWMLSNSLFWILMTYLYPDIRMSQEVRIVSTVLSFFWSAIPLILSFALSNRKWRTTFIVLGCLSMLYGIYRIVEQGY